MTREARGAASGYSLVVLMVGIAVTLILMTAAVPTWRYLMKNDREEELLFRGREIADGIVRYQRRNGNALPTSLDAMVKGKFLRRAYKDPMTRDGNWKFLKPGDVLFPVGSDPLGRGGATPTTTTTTTTRPSAFGPNPIMGGFIGVASTSTEKSLRTCNGRSRYNEWAFMAGQPCIVGQSMLPPAGMRGAGAPPFGSPAQAQPPRAGGAGAPPGAPVPGGPGGLLPTAPPYVVPP